MLDIKTRLEELAQLQDGWLDGEGHAPERAVLLQLAEAFKTHYAPELPLPHLYPTMEGGVQAEWSLSDWEVSLEVTLPSLTALYQALNYKTGETRVLDLTLSDNDAWNALNNVLRACV